MSEVKELTAKQRAEQIRKSRTTRRPFDGRVTRFPTLPERQGFRTHWFNDDKGKVERALSNGWEFSKRAGFTDDKIDLQKAPNKRISVRVGTHDDGTDMFAYAMDVPIEIYQEDRERKAAPQKQRMAYIAEGKTEKSGLEGTETEQKVTSNIQTKLQID